MDKAKNVQYINNFWDEAIIPTLVEYVKIPNKSPAFDPQWLEHGYIQQAVDLLANWCKQHALPDMQLKVIQLENRTPIIFIDIPGNNSETILLYGHLDKQPEMKGWAADLHPWKPVLKNNRLYGRGAADDGYAIFASLAAIKSLANQKIPHARCIILIEACEESGSYDLPFYIDALKTKIGKPNLVICLDSGCGNYKQLWLTTSLRGLTGGTLSIQVLKHGVHSGVGSGVVPSCFRILRQLLNRVENEKNGNCIINELKVSIPKNRRAQIKKAAKTIGKSLTEDLSFAPGVKAEHTSLATLLERRTWHAALSLIGNEDIPSISNAGNVTLPQLSVKLSLRLPPTCDPVKAAKMLKKTLEEKPPYNAKIKFDVNELAPGWNAPAEKPWLAQAVNQASKNYFGKEALYIGEGGTIPFMGMLGKKFPQAQFLITGVLGPHSNAHGPNEFLHIPTAKKITACIAQIIEDHYYSANTK